MEFTLIGKSDLWSRGEVKWRGEEGWGRCQVVHSLGCKAREDPRSSRLEEVRGYDRKYQKGKLAMGNPCV